MVQKLAVGAVHEPHTFADAAHGRVAQRHGFPGDGGNALGAEHGFADVLIGGAGQPSIDGLQRLSKVAALQRCQAWIGRGAQASKGVTEPAERIGAVAQEIVERHDDGDRTARWPHAEPHRIEPGTTGVEVDIEAVSGAAATGFVNREDGTG